MQWAKKAILKKLDVLGCPVEVDYGERVEETTALILPSVSSFEPARETKSLPDGYLSPGSYEYYGPPEVALTEARTIKDGRRSFLVRRSELYISGGEPIFWWGVLVQGGESG